MTELSVIIPTHNPDRERLRRVLAALCAQSADASRWETIIVDNASTPPVTLAELCSDTSLNVRLVAESTLGLTAARARGFREARGAVCVLVDDDNVLAPDYLDTSLRLMNERPDIEAFGGRVIAEFERDPQPWHSEFFGLLAVRDFGESERVASAPEKSVVYPDFAPIGAGMVVRTTAAERWLGESTGAPSDRQGSDLGSSGDNDIVFSILEHGGAVGYFPQLKLTHLIPAGRLDTQYLARLNRGIQRSWMQVLSRHDANPWPQIPAWTVPLRKAKAWIVYRAWSGPSARVRWQGACGHFEGRATTIGSR